MLCVWRWGSKYPGHYVERLKVGIARNIKQEYRFAVFCAPKRKTNACHHVRGGRQSTASKDVSSASI
jgi:hypothetical protein